MYKSQNEKSKGPYLHVDISATKIPLTDISGFVEVLGISVEARLLISSERYEVFVEGKFLGMFQACLRIVAKYSKNIASGGFQVEDGINLLLKIKSGKHMENLTVQLID